MTIRPTHAADQAAASARAAASLPDVIERFQAAQDARDAAAAASLCAADVVVIDDGRTYTGRDGVADFVRNAAAEFTFTRSLLDAGEESPGVWVVTNRVVGDFPGSPVVLRYHFTVADDQVAALTIAP